MTIALRVSDLSVHYGDHHALQTLDLEIEAGELIGIIAVSYTHLTLPTIYSV